MLLSLFAVAVASILFCCCGCLDLDPVLLSRLHCLLSRLSRSTILILFCCRGCLDPGWLSGTDKTWDIGPGSHMVVRM